MEISEQDKINIALNLMKAVVVYTHFISEANLAGAFTEEILNEIATKTGVDIKTLRQTVDESLEAFTDTAQQLVEISELLEKT